MDYLQQLCTNRILIASLSAWVIAQLFKVLNNLIFNKEFSIERLFGDGVAEAIEKYALKE